LLAGNLLDDVPERLETERIDLLLVESATRVERIVSTGQVSPPGFWYDQEQAEFVVLLAGTARLRIDGEAEPRDLRPGSYVYLPAHRRHRVEWTSAAPPAVWLALHLRD
jgi:cupin 2 domain-containing protein